MTTILYQIGDLPVYDIFSGVDGKGVQLDLGRDWENPTASFTNIGGTLSFLPATRSIPKQPQLSIKTSLLQAGSITPQKALEHLKSLGGRRDVPIIAFRYESYDDNCCDCTYPVEWIVTSGVILNVKEGAEYKAAKAPFSFEVADVDLKIEIGLVWRTLSPAEWEYRSWASAFIDPYSDMNTQQTFGSVFTHPRSLDTDNANGVKENGYFYRWQTPRSRLSPVFWAEKYVGSTVGGYGSNWTVPGSLEINANPARYSGPTDSTYAFKNLTKTGTVRIVVTRDTGLFNGQTVDEVSSLNLVQLDADLYATGFSGLLTDDIVYTGSVDPFPAFIVRNGTTLPVLPKWSYPGTAVGELGRGYIRLRVEVIGGYCLVAQLHDFGVL